MNSFGVVLLLLACGGCSAKVVQDFNNCGQFFARLNGHWSPPTNFKGDQYKNICQTLNNVVEFATYYDTECKIPVYSAYRFTGLNDCSRDNNNWYIEPQLDNQTLDGNMASESAVRRGLRGEYQALNKDYIKSGFDRGHLAPVYHASSQACANATFTLTNAAPQNPSFNRGQWRKTEKDMGDRLKKECLNVGLSAYVVTGVVPGEQKIGNRVCVPSHFWTVYCCLDNNNKPKLSGAFYGINSNVPVTPMTVQELEGNLTEKYIRNLSVNERFHVFGGSCYENDKHYNILQKKLLHKQFLHMGD